MQNTTDDSEAFDLEKICRICLISKSACGLFQINSTTKTLLWEMFDVKIQDEQDSKVCIQCLKIINKAAELKELAKKSENRIKNVKMVAEEGIQRERSVSLEPGSDSDDGDLQLDIEVGKERISDDEDTKHGVLSIISSIEEDGQSGRRSARNFKSAERAIPKIKSNKRSVSSISSEEDKSSKRKKSNDVSTETFNCKSCEKTFTAAWLLKRHYTVAHSVSMHKCQECTKEFTGMEFLKKHMENKHGSKSTTEE